VTHWITSALLPWLVWVTTTHDSICRLLKWRSVFDYVWNVMEHAQKPDFVFRRKGRVHLNLQGLYFSRLLAAEVCASAVVMLDTPSSDVVWRVPATNSIRQFPLRFLARASPCAVTFQLDSCSTRCEFVVVLFFRVRSSLNSLDSLHQLIYN
jgi:hypothetical protein